MNSKRKVSDVRNYKHSEFETGLIFHEKAHMKKKNYVYLNNLKKVIELAYQIFPVCVKIEKNNKNFPINI